MDTEYKMSLFYFIGWLFIFQLFLWVGFFIGNKIADIVDNFIGHNKYEGWIIGSVLWMFFCLWFLFLFLM